MQLYQLYEYILSKIRKDPIGGHFSIDEDFNPYIKIAVNKYYRKLNNLPKNWQPGMRIDQHGAGVSSINEDKMRYLKVYFDDQSQDVNGRILIPDNYLRYISITANDGEGGYIPVPILNEQEFDFRKSSKISYPTSDKPIGKVRELDFEFLPVDLDSLNITYYRYPTIPILKGVFDNETLETIYIDVGATLIITVLAAAGNTINLTADAQDLGTYTIQSGDGISDALQGLVDDINLDSGTHNCQAIYDGEYVYIKVLSGSYTTLNVTASGSTYSKTDFATMTTECDWETDNESMDEIANFIIDMIGLSTRQPELIQYSEKELAK